MYENTDIIADFWSKYPKMYDLCDYLTHNLCISVTKPGFLYILAKHQLLLTSPNAPIVIYYKNHPFLAYFAWKCPKMTLSGNILSQNL